MLVPMGNIDGHVPCSKRKFYRRRSIGESLRAFVVTCNLPCSLTLTQPLIIQMNLLLQYPRSFQQLGLDVLAVFELRSGRVIGRPLCQLCVSSRINIAAQASPPAIHCCLRTLSIYGE